VAAHIGYIFDVTLMTKLTNILPHEIETSLTIAILNDFIQKCGDTTYRFANEKVYAAAEARFQDDNLAVC
jgi:hypothetical protein